MTPDRDEQKAREIVAAWVPADHPGLTRAIASALREARREERERCAALAKAVAEMKMFRTREEAFPHGDAFLRWINEGDWHMVLMLAFNIRALEDK